MPKGIDVFYSQAMLDWIKEHVWGCPHKKLAEDFNRNFKVDYTVECLRHLCQRKGWHNGFTGRFEKGCTPFNKGKKMPEEIRQKVLATCFKKGHMPYNSRAIGSERVQADGYVYVKIGEPNEWKQKHHIEWEKYNPPLEKGEILYFLDGDKTNCSIENLYLTKKEYIGAINHLKKKCPDQAKTRILLGSLQCEVKKAKLKIRKKRQIRSDKYEAVRDLLEKGCRTVEIAKKLNMSEGMVRWYARRIEVVTIY